MLNFWIKLKRNIYPRKPYRLLLGLGLPFICSTGLAYINDLPIQVTSDVAQIDAHAGLATHWGNVLMRQGSREIFGEKLVVHRNHDGVVDTLTALGTPATYKGDIEEIQDIFGQAQRILYFPQSGQVLLEGNAELNQGHDFFQGPQIRYDIAEKTVTSEPDDALSGRSTIQIQPR